MAKAKGEAASEANPVGRPSKYDSAFCERVIAVMGDGYSFTAFCGEVGIAKDTGYNWVKEHQEFSDAVKVARAMRLRALEEKLLTGDTGPRITAMIFALKNADTEEWREKVTNEHTGRDGGPIQSQAIPADPIEAARAYQKLMRGN
jgi:transposase-like protein